MCTAVSCTVGRKEERILEATEIRMLSRSKGITLKDRKRSENIRKEFRVNDIIKKDQNEMVWPCDEDEGKKYSE